MLNEPRTYRNPPFQIGLVIVIFGILGISLLTTITWTDYLFLIPFAGIFGVVFLVIIYSMTAKVTISDHEISIQNLLGTKSLAWNEISRVSGSGNSIKLHNNFGDVTIAPSQQLPGYEEIVNWIGIKRPDLFNPLDYGEMSRSLLNTMVFPVFGLMFFGFGFFIYTQSDAFFPMLMLLVLGVVFISMTFTMPQAISILNNSIVISYLLHQKTVLAVDLRSVSLRYTQTKNGRNYFVALTLTNNKNIRITGLSPNLPVVYLVLKNWHKKYTESNPINR